MNELLLLYITSALTYDLKIQITRWDYELDQEVDSTEVIVGIDRKFIYTRDLIDGKEGTENTYPLDGFDGKLYLRSLDDMTEEELEEYFKVSELDTNGLLEVVDRVSKGGKKIPVAPQYHAFNWLLKKKFDVYNLIKNNLAIKL